MSNAAAIEQTIKVYFDCLNQEDWVGLREVWHPEAEIRQVGNEPRCGAGEIVALLEGALGSWERHHDEPVRILVSGAVATVEINFTGAGSGGRAVEFEAVDVIDFEGDRIKRLTTWYDLDLARAAFAEA